MKNLTEKLNKLMNKKRITCLELSRMTGIPNTTLSAIVKGNTKKLDVTKLQAICNALECTLDYLMNDDIKIETLSKEIANSDEVKNFIEFLESADSDSIKLVLKLIDKLGGKNE